MQMDTVVFTITIDNLIEIKLDLWLIGSSPNYGIGPTPEKNMEFQNDIQHW